MKLILLTLIACTTLTSCVEECKEPECWNYAWKLQDCYEKDGIKHCWYKENNGYCGYIIKQVGECKWEEVSFGC